MSYDPSESDFSSCSDCNSKSNVNGSVLSKWEHSSSSCADTTYSVCDTESMSCNTITNCSSNTLLSSCDTTTCSVNTSCVDTLTDSCLDCTDVSVCDTSSCDTTCSTSCSCDNVVPCGKLVLDLAVADVSVLPTDKVESEGNYVGTRVLARGYVYKGCTLCCCHSELFEKCGVVGDKPEYPKKVIGTYEEEYVIVNPEFNYALDNLFSGDTEKYLCESKRLAGRVLANASLTVSLSDSDDFFLPSEDTIQLEGRVPWGLKGQEWLMAVTGGTGDFKLATGQAGVERLTVANGSDTKLGESWRLCMDFETLLNKPKC